MTTLRLDFNQTQKMFFGRAKVKQNRHSCRDNSKVGIRFFARCGEGRHHRLFVGGDDLADLGATVLHAENDGTDHVAGEPHERP